MFFKNASVSSITHKTRKIRVTNCHDNSTFVITHVFILTEFYFSSYGPSYFIPNCRISFVCKEVLVTNSLSFYLPGISFFFLHFCNRGFLIGRVFFPLSALWKYSPLLCDLQSIWWEMCLESYWDLFKCNESFLFFFFSRFSLSLSLDILVMCPSVGPFGLSYSELVELLRCLYSHLSSNLGNIQALFCQIICLTLFLSFFWDWHSVYVGLPDGDSQSPQTLFTFIFFPSCP